MPNHDKTTRTPAPLPQEQHGLSVLVNVLDLRWVWLHLSGCSCLSFCTHYRLDVTFEPIFAELALYDAKERKKVP